MILLFVVVLLLAALPPRLGLFLGPVLDAATVVVLGLDLLLVVEIGEVQAAFLVDRPALLVETRTTALPQLVEQVHVAAGAVLVPHRHAVDQGVGETPYPSQCACLAKRFELLPLVIVRRSPRPSLGLDEVFRQPVKQPQGQRISNTV